MKKLLSAIALVSALSLFTGCASSMGSISKNLSKDPAIVVVRLGTPWGTESFTRVGGQQDNVTVSPEGTVTITQTKTNAFRSAPQQPTLQIDPATLAALRRVSAPAPAAPSAPVVTTNAPSAKP